MPISVSRRAWQRASAVSAVAATAAVVVAGAAAWPSASQRGKKLFTGAVSLQARMAGHDSDLPPETARCSNCHPVAQAAAGGSSAAKVSAFAAGDGKGPIEAFAPMLSRASLTQPARRRGGPASSYSSQQFCRVLRDGIDPAHVMVPQTMPRYTLTDSECKALWAYTTAN